MGPVADRPPTKLPLKRFYRSLLGVYTHACLSPWRARRLGLPTAPPIWSPKFLRLWSGRSKIAAQFLAAHRHHTPRELARATDRGPAYTHPTAAGRYA